MKLILCWIYCQFFQACYAYTLTSHYSFKNDELLSEWRLEIFRNYRRTPVARTEQLSLLTHRNFSIYRNLMILVVTVYCNTFIAIIVTDQIKKKFYNVIFLTQRSFIFCDNCHKLSNWHNLRAFRLTLLAILPRFISTPAWRQVSTLIRNRLLVQSCIMFIDHI